MDQDPEGVAEVHHQSPLHLPEWPADPVRDAATAPPHTDQGGNAPYLFTAKLTYRVLPSDNCNLC